MMSLKTTKRTSTQTQNDINSEAKYITKKIRLDNRIECLPTQEAYITFKDHKSDFNINPRFRFIKHPTKTKVGLINRTDYKED